MDDRIQSCIDHIKSAVDVDPWAAELAERALKHYGKCGRWGTLDEGDGDVSYVCSECGERWSLCEGTPEENHMYFCPKCGAKMETTE